MKFVFVDIDELLAKENDQPRYVERNEVDVYIADGMAHVRVYRGSNTHSIEGITWWTTDKRIALGTFYDGVLLERVISIPVVGNTMMSPYEYVVGGRGDLPDIPSEYSYGIEGCLDIDSKTHFNISINKSALNLITKEEY